MYESDNSMRRRNMIVQIQDYVIHWRNYPGTAHTVFCEIFIHGKKSRVATHFMDKDKPETQTRSSLGRINALITGSQGNDWLSAPTPSKRGKYCVVVIMNDAKNLQQPTSSCTYGVQQVRRHMNAYLIQRTQLAIWTKSLSSLSTTQMKTKTPSLFSGSSLVQQPSLSQTGTPLRGPRNRRVCGDLLCLLRFS